jgi:hypothetical protein
VHRPKWTTRLSASGSLVASTMGTVPSAASDVQRRGPAKAGRQVRQNPFARLGDLGRWVVVTSSRQARSRSGSWFDARASWRVRRLPHRSKSRSPASVLVSWTRCAARNVDLDRSCILVLLCADPRASTGPRALAPTTGGREGRGRVGRAASILRPAIFAGWSMVDVFDVPFEDVAIARGHTDGGELVRRLYSHRDHERALDRVTRPTNGWRALLRLSCGRPDKTLGRADTA